MCLLKVCSTDCLSDNTHETCAKIQHISSGLLLHDLLRMEAIRVVSQLVKLLHHMDAKHAQKQVH